MLKIKDPAVRYGILFALIYMVSYLTRINFGAVVSEIERSTGISKDLLSLSLTGSFVTYGIGQVISGLAGDRLNPKSLISIGLGVTAAMNLTIPMCKSPYAMLAVWCVNGFAQSFMWPPIVKMLTDLLTEEEYKRGTVIVSWGSSAGTIGVYLLSPLIISVGGWKWVFAVSAACAIVTLILWQSFRYQPQFAEVRVTKGHGSTAMLFTPMMLGVMLCIVLQGMLRDGVTTWMPSYISETYGLSTVASILTGVILPIFSVLCYQLAARLYRNILTNPIACAAVFFGGSVAFAVLLYFVTGGNAMLSVLFSALLTGCTHGVNMMLISMVPSFFKRYGIAGTASGMLNACTYIGSALSTYGIAVLSQTAGWKNTVLIWTAIAAIGTIICVACIGKWKKQFA